MFKWRVYASLLGAILIFLAINVYNNVVSTSELTPIVLPEQPAIPGLPSPLRVTEYSPDSTFFGEEEDLNLIGEVFNAVLVANWYVRKQQWEPIQKIVDAGLIPIIKFDTAKYLFRGDVDEVRLRTDEVIAGVEAAAFPLNGL